MTSKHLKFLLANLKIMLVVASAVFVVFFASSFTASRHMAGDFWQLLGITRSQGTDNIKQSFLNNYLYYYGARNARNLAVGDRVAVARDLLNYSKQYLNSDGFRKEYELNRKNSMPHEPQPVVRTKEELRAAKIAETEKSLKETQENAKKLGPDMAKAMQSTIDMLKKNIEDYKNPKSEIIDSYYQGEVDNAEREKKHYRDDLARWQKDYPADFRDLLKMRLQRFLDISATVDFNAALKQVGNKMKFVKAEYEAKPNDWKQIYRAGNDVISMARTFAEQWIRELGAK